ncbi:hypothetical protein ACFL43_06270, partial [Thermodesulfobacteriota bacterium]
DMQTIRRLVIIPVLTLVCFFGFLTSGCQQQADEQINAAIEAAMNTAMMLYTAATAYSSTLDLEALLSGEGCPDITVAGDVGDRILSISYDDDCAVDGIHLSGELAGEWSFAQGAGVTVDVSVDGFTVADFTADGSISMHADSVQGALVTIDADMTVNDQTLSVSDLIATANLNQTLGDPSDDEYAVDGSGTYIYEGSRYAATFNEVVAGYGCYVPVSGTITLKSAEYFFPAIVRFGDGTCDTLFTVSVGLRTEEVDLADWISMY